MNPSRRLAVVFLYANLLFLAVILSYFILSYDGMAHYSATVGFISGAITMVDAICFYTLFLRKTGANREEWRN